MIDASLSQSIINQAGKHRLPVPPKIQSDSNPDLSDGGHGSHDTILMLFQNGDGNEATPILSDISQKSELTRSKKLSTILKCQELLSSDFNSWNKDGLWSCGRKEMTKSVL